MRAQAGRTATTHGLARQTLVVVSVVAGMVILLRAIWTAADVLLIIFAGLLFAILLGAMTEQMMRRLHLRHGVSLAITIVGLAAIVTLAAALVAPAVADQLSQLQQRLPQAIDQLRQSIERNRWGRVLVSEGLRGQPGRLIHGVGGVFSAALGLVGNVLVIVILGVFVAAEPELYRDGVLHLAPPEGRARAGDILDELAATLRRWLLGQLVAMSVVGILTTIGLAVMRMPLALTLGLFAGIATFVPYFGGIAATTAGVLLALTHGAATALWTALLYLAVYGAEGYLITPMIQRRAVHLPPALLLGSQLVLAVLLGGLGLVFATPLTAAAMVLVRRLYQEEALGEPVAREGV
jgi:predicted PurR-regulated permease PerM